MKPAELINEYGLLVSKIGFLDRLVYEIFLVRSSQW